MLLIKTDNFAKATKDIPVADADLLNPNIGPTKTPFEDGEWVVLDANEEVVRAASNALNAFMLYTERGRTDTQAIQKATVLFDYEGLEIETDMWEQANFANYTIGTLCTLQTVALTAPTAQCVLHAPAASGEPYYAQVTGPPASNAANIKVRLGRFGHAA